MKLRDLVSEVRIDPHKLTEYALNPANPIGSHKARVFEAVLGYTRDNYQAIIKQIETRALDTDALVQRTDIYGQHVRVDLEIVGVAGQRAIVRTGWLVVPGSNEAQLTTLYVRKVAGV